MQSQLGQELLSKSVEVNINPYRHRWIKALEEPFVRASLALSLILLVIMGVASCDDESEGDARPRADFLPNPDRMPSGCGPGLCQGCCLDGICQPGTMVTACGFGGIACTTCRQYETCPNGTCLPPKCDTTSCADGCCDSTGTCQKGSTDDACGNGAQPCSNCPSNETCFDKECGPKGEAMYKVTLVSAKVTGSTILICGFGEGLGDCDMYVILTVGKAKVESSIKDDTNSPVWNEFMLAATQADLIAGFQVEIRDDDPVGSVQVGKCEPQVTLTELEAGQIVFDCEDAKEVTFTFKKF